MDRKERIKKLMREAEELEDRIILLQELREENNPPKHEMGVLVDRLALLMELREKINEEMEQLISEVGEEE